ncbi:MAG: 16S rRNA (cytosine(1402)-N(4))-methyltransferase RsmH [Ruminococcaceae bacterium]|nr:16S rRNA (cytosine(1402)-N(4))-methyltransferase RsmH [Oscillospiraceae bacterium]
MGGFNHFSVLLNESVEMLELKPDGVYVDCTLGGGGHSLLLAQGLSEKGRIIGIDRDKDAIKAASERLREHKEKMIFVNDNFVNLEDIVKKAGFDSVDGIIMDLGVSSYQLDTPERGFSYHNDAPLDMRMCREDPLTAADVVNKYSRQELTSIIFRYGEEKNAASVARAICNAREKKPIETTLELAEIVKSAFSAKERFEGKHPARRTFQAIRIEVNGELEIIPKAIDAGVRLLKKGGIISIITFHSLEDRAVKEAFKGYVSGCTCPKSFPVCVCGFKQSLELVNRKPVLPSDEENSQNSRSRSAKLRGARKIV